MAVTFLEPGGDATFNVDTTTNGGFWTTKNGTPIIATDFVHGGHIKSIQFVPNANNNLVTATGTLADAGSRVSFYFYISALPNATHTIVALVDSSVLSVVKLRLTSAGVLQLTDSANLSLGSDGATLSTGVWYRISIACTVASTTVNEFRVFVDSVSSISVTNATLTRVDLSRFQIGSIGSNLTSDYRSSDHYIDNSSSLTDTGDIWVTAKRPNANGTTNGFTTQIGVSGSRYGSGHSPQVNERALSTTNGWAMVGAGAAVTEQYNIESAATGDIDISTYTIVGSVGWVYCSSLAGSTINVLLDGQSYSQAITSTNTMYLKVSNKLTYPVGTGTDIGIQTSTALTTFSLYECGVVVAYIPVAPATSSGNSAWIAG
jgi:hypothetical protein